MLSTICIKSINDLGIQLIWLIFMPKWINSFSPYYFDVFVRHLELPEELLEQFSADSLQFYRTCFKMYDVNNDGLISAKELSQVSKKLGYSFSNDQIEVEASIAHIQFIHVPYNKVLKVYNVI